MQIGVVYTSTTPELVEMINEQLGTRLEDIKVDIISYQDPSILQETIENGRVTEGCARRLLSLYENAVKDGADIIFSICSSVGDVANAAKPMYEMTGIHFVRMDEDMAMNAVQAAERVGVIATLKTTLEPTKRLVLECAERLGKKVQIVDGLAEGAFGLDQVQFKEKLIETGEKIKDQVDVLLLAQGSMAYAEEAITKALQIPVYSSIRFGVAAVGDAAESLLKRYTKE